MSKKEEQAYAKRIIDDYVSSIDWRTKENSNVGYSIGGLILHNSSALIANYWLNEVYTPEIAEAHQKASFHIHDLGFLGGYCAGWSLRQLVEEGLGGVEGKISSKPASHLVTLCNQMVNFLGVMQNEWAGAQAFSSFDTYLAPFIKKENLSDKKIKQALQSFIFGVNTPSRWGCVPISTRVLSTRGWKKYNELTEQDYIYTWKNGSLNICKVNKVIVKEYKDKLIEFYNDQYRYKQRVTKNHRVLVSLTNKKSEEAIIMTAEEIASNKNNKYWHLPTSFNIEKNENSINLTDEEIILAAMIYTDGSIDMRKNSVHKIKYHKSQNRLRKLPYNPEDIFIKCGLKFSRKEKINGFGKVSYDWVFYGDSARFIYNLVESREYISEKFLEMNQNQANIFLNIWELHDGDEIRHRCQCDNNKIIEQILHINILAGKVGSQDIRNLYSGTKVNYTKTIEPKQISFQIREIDYDDKVWCPNVDDGTAIFLSEDNSVFISGQTQAPFSNITLDWVCPEDMKEKKAIVGGKEQDFTYGDCQPEMDRLNSIYIDLILEGDANGRGFQYPIPTYNLTKEFNWDGPNCQKLFEMTGKYGTPYFQNFINSDLNPSDVRSMCCRLQLSLTELRKRGGGLFGADEFTGSMGVVTINLPQIAFLAIDEQDFYERLEKLMVLAKDSLILKRKKVTELNNMGMFPYTKRYLSSFRNHFNTIGVCGMNEACINFFDKDIASEEGKAFAERVLNFMRDKMVHFQEETGELFNLEATPAESTSYRLAKHDKKNFPGIHTSGNGEPYYTNSSQLPVNYTDDIFEALDHQESLQCAYTGGTVVHTNLGQRVEDWKTTRELVKTIASNYKIPYFTISPIYSICPVHGYLDGEHEFCPKCKEEKIRRIDAQIESLRKSEESLTI